MTRTDAVAEAAVFGVVGVVLISLGGLVGSFLFSTLDAWVAAAVTLPVWLACLYLGMKQFANGIYTLVEDARA